MGGVGGMYTYKPQFQGMGGATMDFNPGQDSLLQMMRADPYDISKVTDALEPIDKRLLNEQVASLQGSSGSLGQRFGTASANRESNLRRDFLQNITGRNAQLASGMYESAQGRRLQAAGAAGQLGQQANEFGATQGNIFNQFIMQALAQQNAMQAGQNQQNMGWAGLMAGVPVPQGQPSPWPGAAGDIGQLLMLLPFLRRQ
jgi:hypothetical protein